jgi:ADP-ribose pyrophosphatase YjhB (NUDIX family)
MLGTSTCASLFSRDTHLRFFTLKTIKELVESSGFVMTKLNRVRVPAFETELTVDRFAVPTAVLDDVLRDPEAETYQFVFSAVADDGNHRLQALAGEKVDLESAVSSLRIRLLAAEAERERLREHLRETESRIHAARQDLADSERRASVAREDLARVYATKTFRNSARARGVYERLRAPR